MSRVLGLDVGDVRIGIALSDEMRWIATPHSVYTRVGWGPDTRKLMQIYRDNDCGLAVCGLPRNMDGSVGFQAEKVMALPGRTSVFRGISRLSPSCPSNRVCCATRPTRRSKVGRALWKLVMEICPSPKSMTCPSPASWGSPAPKS